MGPGVWLEKVGSFTGSPADSPSPPRAPLRTFISSRDVLGPIVGEAKLFMQFILSLWFSFSSPLRKDQLEAAARYVSDHEFPSSHHHVGTEGPVLYGLGTLGGKLVTSSSLGLSAVADHHIPLPFSCEFTQGQFSCDHSYSHWVRRMGFCAWSPYICFSLGPQSHSVRPSLVPPFVD